MIKDTIIAILAGIAIAQRIPQPGDPARVAIALVTAVVVFMLLLEMEDLWDKRQRRRRRQLMQDYIRRLQEMTAEQKGGHQRPEESEV